MAKDQREESQEGLAVTKFKGKECFEKLTMLILQCRQDNDCKMSIVFNNKEFDTFGEGAMKQTLSTALRQ